MTHRRARRVASLLAASALALNACSGGDEPAATSDEPASSSAPTSPSSSDDASQADGVTPPGTQLAFGDNATVLHEADDQEMRLTLRVDSAVQGSLEDFQGFDMQDPYKRKGNYYYVRVTVKNAGKKTVAGVPVPLWGLSGENTLL